MRLEIFLKLKRPVLVGQSDVAGQLPWAMLGRMPRLAGVMIGEALLQIGRCTRVFLIR